VKALRADSEALKVALEKIEKQLLLIASLEHANEELQQLLKRVHSDSALIDTCSSQSSGNETRTI
jgi:hypothetical protein